jgi:protein-tyrosine phosphatase
MGDIHRFGGPAQRRLMLRAAMTSVLLSVFFVLVYGGTNWLTAHRPGADVGTWYFTWELAAIPYVPLLIVPYMSIDLFFFFAAFLCRTEREMRVFAERVVFCIVVASAFFLLVPLKLAWPERPRVDGWFGEFVEQSCTAPFLMEYPHDLFPALHIALCVILADLYARHTRGWVKALSNIWFGLIAVSTVLTWQHHLVDLAGGGVLTGVACCLFQEHGQRLPSVANRRIGGYYLGAAVLLLIATQVLMPWGLFLLWPALGVAIIGAGYFGRGPGIFRKAKGIVPPSALFLFALVLPGHFASIAYYRRRSRPWDEVAPGVLMGRWLTNKEAATAVQQGVTAVLDLTAELSEAAAFRSLTYLNLPVLDLSAPTPEQLRAAVSFLMREAARGTVYVHCKVGYSRSAAIAGAYLLASRRVATVDEAVARLRSARPGIVIRAEALEALRGFARTGLYRSVEPVVCGAAR